METQLHLPQPPARKGSCRRARNSILPNFSNGRPISWAIIGKEPFRVFFPAGVLAGILGVALWPLHFGGLLELYPGQTHARIMAFGLFGAFIFGFLGTAMPRMLSARPLELPVVLSLLVMHASMVISYVAGKLVVGDLLLLLMLVVFAAAMGVRARQRKDIPPPGFVLVGMAFLCLTAASIIAVIEHFREIDLFWILLQRLLAYQGFVLLPILGIGPFILPRFFGLPSEHNLPEALLPTSQWIRKAVVALSAGGLIIISFILEASGRQTLAHCIRFATTLIYLAMEMPFRSAPGAQNALGAAIRIAFAGILAGFLAVSLWPAYRVALLHLTLVGGFAVITFVVATRVIFGHSGNLRLLQGGNRWLLVAVGFMLAGMATRVSGDFWPHILVSHYRYGAALWIAGVLLWSAKVLPKVLVADTED